MRKIKHKNKTNKFKTKRKKLKNKKDLNYIYLISSGMPSSQSESSALSIML